ncbi:DUF2278 family protein [Burkholderia ubonensis]|uniref:DUF2278 family protein n=1 Tax=Burkholderia ubonensis TaxID=101571 RepID=A0AB74D886_9BURK|nr:DUF2278 family protein [Burkholderia ubonensis]PAJ81599.1 hypothetical protein CJO71_06675 [Burkholderia ubonensis]PAJ88455.1 hypothetical protein CJO70_06485 [Burkholderia ubonensis]PAJ95007.1 hypothetical protein CJO69_08885 [Burkholderia ubonensis]PAJ99295.1 hypothetical protein CJO68_21950 [Burkholderia ubonensis]PAK08924.1 hypothetical protein CJO67_06245 [Burkholderia ubonensis]
MPIVRYGVLKGRPIQRKLEVAGDTPHYQIHVIDLTNDYRVPVNVRSMLAPHEVQYLVDEAFSHPILDGLTALSLGFHGLDSTPGGLALDYIRGNLFDRSQMRSLPFNLPGPDNDLNEKIDRYVSRALAEPDAILYAFGQRFGPPPDPKEKDKIFAFAPQDGVHDIHMNQGNPRPQPGQQDFFKDNGVWQDGGLLIYYPSNQQWVAIFLKFASQAWHTDDTTGVPLEVATEPDFTVRIVAAMINPVGPDQGLETVTLLNTSAQAVSLNGWALANKTKDKFLLDGTLAPGATQTITLPQNFPLSNKGGIITLLDAQGLKVHGVSYTAAQAKREGETIVF